jgi:integrase
MRSLWKQAMRRKIVLHDPFQDLPPIKKQEVRTSYLTKEELQRMWDKREHIREATWQAFWLALNTGMRLGEIERLEWSMIRSGTIYLPADITKATKDRNIPMNQGASDIIASREKHGTIVFHNLMSRPMINRDLHMWRQMAQVDQHVHFHLSRHTFATHLLDATGNIMVVKELLGHSELATTQRYAKLIDDKKTDAVNQLDL